ncbi:MAG: hypothetical protein DWQ34_20515 [Planctomycetota bacterium]|nr:MAG: hypothetical protein DWQ34_20515 [Planctomycetota bacterium]REJ92255.1 MAG: hypothetical protein DWQ29_04990 [Planctomycetota bacterium]REK29764.1 MAG: hypothetical protein DWQ41_03780 [Planctomycetota bacterium]REK30415.1 MAG: hypothetical protein DWQ45_21255 [Planctomycetota bacterium]
MQSRPRTAAPLHAASVGTAMRSPPHELAMIRPTTLYPSGGPDARAESARESESADSFALPRKKNTQNPDAAEFLGEHASGNDFAQFTGAH